MGNPKILNLDEVELGESEVEIVHEGKSHKMRVLSVDVFIAQQKRQRAHERALAKADANDDDTDVTDAVELIKESILEFFPTLPVGDLPTPKLFRIFAFLNELSSRLNDDASGDVIEDSADEAGNAPAAAQTEK